MAQAGFTPIIIYSSATSTNAPLAANLVQGELAINTADGKLFYKDSSNLVQTIGWKTVPVSAGGTGATTAPQANANLQTFTTTATAAGTTTLTNTSTYYQYFTGSTTQTILLPVTSTLSLGWSFHIANNSTGNLSLQSSGGNLLALILPGTSVHVTCILTSGTTAASWDYGFTDFSSITGTGGGAVLSQYPSILGAALSAETYLTSATFAAGTDAQGQGAIGSTSDFVVVTTTATNPSGVTLPSATVGRRIIVVNRGTNPINVYPNVSASIDSIATNSPISIPVNGWMEFNASTTLKWYSTANITISYPSSVSSFSGGTTGLRTYTTPTKATTISVASPAVFTVAGADLPANNTQIELFTTGALPTGLSVNTVYYVINSSGTTFNVSLTSGGVGVNTTVAGSGTQTFGVLGTNGSLVLDGTLAVANGGTGINSFGTGVATWLGTPNSANLRAAVTDETGTGSLVFSTNPTFADLSNSGNITFTGTSNRISGDFSNATLTSRVLFQSSTVNGNTVLGTIPNGSSTTSGYVAYGATDASNSSYGTFNNNGTTTYISADKSGSGSYGAMVFSTSATERLRITTAGGVSFGATGTDYGTTGQVLKSNGNTPPSWQDGMTPTSGTAPYFGARAFAAFATNAYSDIVATYGQTTTTVILTVASHSYKVGHYIYVDITSGTAVDGLYVVTAVTPTTITYTAGTSLLITGNATIKQCSVYAGSQNVANVVYPGTGIFVVNFTTAMPSVNYVATASAGVNNGGTPQSGDDNYIAFSQGANTGIRTTQSIRGFCFQPTTQALENSSLISIVVFA